MLQPLVRERDRRAQSAAFSAHCGRAAVNVGRCLSSNEDSLRPGSRQWSTGGKPKLLGISKRGNPYLRKMVIHGARAAMLRVKREGSWLGQWMSGLETRAARNVVIGATANKLASIGWAVRRAGMTIAQCTLPRGRFQIDQVTCSSLRRSLQKKRKDERTVKRRAREPAS